MSVNEYFEVFLKGRKYKLNIEKLCELLSLISDDKIEKFEYSRIKRLMKKYKLINKMFLENFEKI